MGDYGAVVGGDKDMSDESAPILVSFRDVSQRVSLHHSSSQESLSGGDTDGQSSEAERECVLPELSSSRVLKVYRYRWWVLFVVWLAVFEEACLFNTWGPIAKAAKPAFNWTDGTIGLLALWGCIGFIVAAIPVSWAMQNFGLKTIFIFATTMCCLCAAFRCLSFEPKLATVLINVGHVFNGLSAPVALAAGPLISAKWFPPSERVTATAIAGMSTTMGIAASFLIGPLLVPDVHCNATSPALNNTLLDNFTSNYTTYEDCLSGIRDNIRSLMFIEFGVTAAILVLTATSLRDAPPTAPSHSSTVPRLEFRAGLRRLSRNSGYILVSITYGIVNGSFSAWGAVLSLILASYGVTQTESAFIGFYSTIAGGLGGIVMARIADKCPKRHKSLIIIMMILSFIVYISLTLTGNLSSMSINGTVALSTTLLATYYITVILGGVFQYGLIPISLELAVELAYPVAEGVTAILVTLASCIVTVVFLGMLSIPSIGVLWMNWAMLGCFTSCTIALAFLKPRYARLEKDQAA